MSYVIPYNAMLTLYNSDADAIITNTAKNVGDPVEDAIDAGLNVLGLSLDIGSAGVDTLSHTMEALGGVTGVLGGTFLANSIGDKLGILGTTCAVAQISRGMYNIYQGDTKAIF